MYDADYASSLAKFFCALLDMHTCEGAGVKFWGSGFKVLGLGGSGFRGLVLEVLVYGSAFSVLAFRV